MACRNQLGKRIARRSLLVGLETRRLNGRRWRHHRLGGGNSTGRYNFLAVGMRRGYSGTARGSYDWKAEVDCSRKVLGWTVQQVRGIVCELSTAVRFGN